MAKLTLVQAINDALRTEMKLDDRIVILGEDVGENGGVFRATDGLIGEFGRNRVFDTPLAESGIVGSAIGMAAYGLRPVAEIQFEGFAWPAFEQIVTQAARIRHRSRGRFACPMVIRMPYGGGIRALEHHSESPEAIYAHVPGLKVVLPSGPNEAKGLLIQAMRDPDPVIFMEPKRLYRAYREEVPEEAYTIPFGQARVAREGKDVTVVAWGSQVRTALEGAERAAADHGWQAEVLDLRTVSPLDTAAIVKSVQKTRRCVVVQEAPRHCGFASEIATLINEHAFLYLEAPVTRVTGFDVPMPYLLNEDLYLPDSGRVIEAVQEVMTF